MPASPASPRNIIPLATLEERLGVVRLEIQKIDSVLEDIPKECTRLMQVGDAASAALSEDLRQTQLRLLFARQRLQDFIAERTGKAGLEKSED